MCLGACTVSIFSCSTTATRLCGPFFFRSSGLLTLTLNSSNIFMCKHHHGFLV
ncbi:hypothetical protein B0H12DRAFT_1103162 [Mycena haematopus]|nr:hypothetical protein B0H12DRAFT_1103162 [Mycena haematopus]